jgi:hypothetical protein
METLWFKKVNNSCVKVNVFYLIHHSGVPIQLKAKCIKNAFPNFIQITVDNCPHRLILVENWKFYEVIMQTPRIQEAMELRAINKIIGELINDYKF